MEPQIFNLIGLMSGTSLDGIDLAHVELNLTGPKWSYRLLTCQTVPYDSAWCERLKSASTLGFYALSQLDRDYTAYLASVIKHFIAQHGIQNLDAVCSHGHTVLHDPANGLTYQIGNLPQIASLVQQKVVCDFRVQDVALGGQGAPLVPIGDRLLFPESDYCLNLGGFSNVSFERENQRVAFDISPVNTVLNHYANQLGLPFDSEGRCARTGTLIPELLDALNQLAFYRLPYPKSLGFEFVRDTVLPLIDTFKAKIPDILHTFCHHIAIQTAAALGPGGGKILVTGGGAYHSFLMELLQQSMPEKSFETANAKLIEYKEALIFALLGALKLQGEINVLSSVTGALHDHSSGEIYGYF